MNNKIIQSLWIGDKLSNNELLCLRSYAYHDHEFHLYVYDDIPNIPRDIKVKDANAIIPASRLFKDSFNTYGSFADWFRLKLLFQRGGWWVDMDTICVQSFNIPYEYCFSSEWNYGMEKVQINNTCIKSPAGAAYLKGLLDQIEERINGEDPVRWGEIGVYLFRKVMVSYDNVLEHMKEPAVFCPVNYFNLSGLICKNGYLPEQDTLTVHLWNEIWRRGNLDKDAIYHPDSVYERLKKKYLAPPVLR